MKKHPFTYKERGDLAGTASVRNNAIRVENKTCHYEVHTDNVKAI